MPTTVPEAVNRQLVKYEASAKAIASRQHVDLQQLRWATQYVGRNVDHMSDTVAAGLQAITVQEDRIAGELSQVNDRLDRLIDVMSDGFHITFGYLDKISGQLEQMIHILKYPARTLGAEQREKGVYLVGKGKSQLAVKSLQKAIELNECDFISLYALGFVFASNEQYGPAAASFADCALFADSNPAMSAEAAVLAAQCYGRLGENQKAWAVLHKTMARRCPDVCLPLAKYASGDVDKKYAARQLANAFLIDAELYLAAEVMGVSGVDEAANVAFGSLAIQISELKQVWQELYEAGKAAGLPYTKTMPEQPIVENSAGALLMQAAIYRRNIQVAISNFEGALNRRLSTPFLAPELPSKPWRYVDVRLHAFAIIFLSVIGFLMLPLYLLGVPLLVGAIAIIWSDIRGEYISKIGTKAYRRENAQAERAAQIARSKNERMADHADEIKTAIADADKMLILTIPPRVPRAFSGDLVGYTEI
jgi:tetratricopeptide (TPR) repeat protein